MEYIQKSLKKVRRLKILYEEQFQWVGQSDEEKHKAKTVPEKILEKEFITHINLLNISTIQRRSL